MSKATFYGFDKDNPVLIERELYSDVGSNDNIVGDYRRGFKDDLEIWDSLTGGVQLTIDIDYELVNKDTYYTTKSSYNVW